MFAKDDSEVFVLFSMEIYDFWKPIKNTFNVLDALEVPALKPLILPVMGYKAFGNKNILF